MIAYRLLIFGGRHYGRVKRPEIQKDVQRAAEQRRYFTVYMDNVVLLRGAPSLVISGGAPGADTLAEEWRLAWKFNGQVFPAHWNSQGKAAGRIRNKQMLDALCILKGVPTLAVGFPDRDELGNASPGSAHMMEIARARGVEVIEADRIVL